MPLGLKRFIMSLIGLSALVAAAFFLMPSGALSGAEPTGEEMAVAPKSLSFWVVGPELRRPAGVRQLLAISNRQPGARREDRQERGHAHSV
jgi:hypothetical protein